MCHGRRKMPHGFRRQLQQQRDEQIQSTFMAHDQLMVWLRMVRQLLRKRTDAVGEVLKTLRRWWRRMLPVRAPGGIVSVSSSRKSR